MQISYCGHSSFKLKGDAGVVVTDPFTSFVGFSFPKVSADVVTVSHDHPDHNAFSAVSGTARRDKPFIIDQSGEYEVGGISVFGTPTFHDATQGAERGSNRVFRILLDDITVCHLGDLGHALTAEQLSAIGHVDVLLCPVGGAFTIDPEQAVEVIQSIEPSIVIPMHYKTPLHDEKVYADLKTLADFMKVYGSEVQPEERVLLDKSKLPEETELVVLQPTTKD